MTATLRLAMRVEGDFWNAYAADVGTMDGATLLGSIRMTLVENRPMRDAFMSLMQIGLMELIETRTGTTVTAWDMRAAPETERAGRA